MIELLLAFVVAVLVSVLGAMVGSGGVITIPFLMLMGLPPAAAIATSKLGAVGMISGSTARFWREKKIQWKLAVPFLFIGIAGSILGANILLKVEESLLEKGVGVVIILLVPLLLLDTSMGIQRKAVRSWKRWAGFLAYLLIAVYSGFFGPGTGTLILYASMFFFGMTMLESNATSLPAGLASNLASMGVFIAAGILDWTYGLIFFFGGLLGGYIGAHTALHKGDAWVKALFAVVASVMALNLLLK